MKFIVRNQARIPNKYIRFARWKILKLSRKFTDLVYPQVYIKAVSNNPTTYNAIIKMGVPGPDIIISEKSDDLKLLWSKLSVKIKRQLRKYSSKRKNQYS